MRRVGATVARRYARALLDVAQAGSDPAALRRALTDAAAVLREQPELQAALLHPAVPAEKKRAVVAAVWARPGQPELLRRLIDLLMERRRLELLPEIARLFGELWNAQRGVVEAQAVTAAELSAPQADVLIRALAGATGKQVELRQEVDAQVLGGVLVRMGGRIYDGTVRGRLRALREHLGAGPTRPA